MKFYVFCIFLFVSTKLFSQQNNDKLFDNYQTLFQKLNYPFALMFDYEKTSTFKIPPLIPINILNTFVCKYGISCKTQYCSRDKYYGFNALCQLPDNKNNKMLIICESSDAGCGERMYLLVYSAKGTLNDTLLIYGEGRWEQPTKTNPKSQTYAQEGTVYKDSITTKYVQHVGGIVRDAKGRKIYNKNTYRTYIVDKNGKFKTIRERKDEGFEYFTN